ncbi:MAG: DUF4270 domain-containing protein [Bacteroidaceae bacterium]|nr:DUF4270 domain-containing protein [Bacteroidaceae bacterium]
MKLVSTIKYFLVAIVAMLGVSCDDNTDFIGSSLVGGTDYIKAGSATFYPASLSVLADTVYTKSPTAYLGKYTDPKFGLFESSFLTQFNVAEAYEIPNFNDFVPDNGVEGLSQNKYDRDLTPKRFYVGALYTDYFGDSTAVGRINVYELNKDLYASDGVYYSSADPKNYYSTSDLIGSSSYAPTNLSIPSATRDSNYQYVIVDLPVERGRDIIKLYQQCKKNGINFRNKFLNEFKGIYTKQVQGDGAILYLKQVRLYFDFDTYNRDSLGNVYQTVKGTDSISTSAFSFSTTKEIVQVNSFKNTVPTELLKDDTCSYLKSPASLFTKVRLPLKAIADSLIVHGDSLNAVKITFPIDSLLAQSTDMEGPGTLLMIRDTATVNGVFQNYQKDFFADNNLPDSKTSYISSLSDYSYTFSNIAGLFKAAVEDYGSVENLPEYLDVLLIPVSLTYDSSTIISVSHNFEPTYARILGGADPQKKRLKLQVYYSIFH